MIKINMYRSQINDNNAIHITLSIDSHIYFYSLILIWLIYIVELEKQCVVNSFLRI